jgi:hypothetical protein
MSQTVHCPFIIHFHVGHSKIVTHGLNIRQSFTEGSTRMM